MKTFITVIDDNEKVIYTDRYNSYNEEIFNTNPYLRSIKEAGFDSAITQLANFSTADFLNLEIKIEQEVLDKIKAESRQ